MFEGNPQQMQQSLQRMSELPEHTWVCCAHEYTQANLAFAAAVEPNNRHIEHHQQQVAMAREAGLPSLPSTIKLEREINPFLRTRELDVIHAAQNHSENFRLREPAEVFAALRQWKDNF